MTKERVKFKTRVKNERYQGDIYVEQIDYGSPSEGDPYGLDKVKCKKEVEGKIFQDDSRIVITTPETNEEKLEKIYVAWDTVIDKEQFKFRVYPPIKVYKGEKLYGLQWTLEVNAKKIPLVQTDTNVTVGDGEG